MVTTSRLLFSAFALLLGIQRLAELRLSRRNEARIQALGGYEVGQGHFRAMQILHTGWFAAMLLEAWLLKRPFLPGLALPAAVLFSAGQALRYAAILALGRRWSVRVMIQPGEPAIRSGIYRYLRHPNYLGVALELLAAPLLHSAYLTGLVFSVLNAYLLSVRIRIEEQALSKGSDYAQVFQGQKRFIPKIF
jgi:methyltransferase